MVQQVTKLNLHTYIKGNLSNTQTTQEELIIFLSLGEFTFMQTAMLSDMDVLLFNQAILLFLLLCLTLLPKFCVMLKSNIPITWFLLLLLESKVFIQHPNPYTPVWDPDHPKWHIKCFAKHPPPGLLVIALSFKIVVTTITFCLSIWYKYDKILMKARFALG